MSIKQVVIFISVAIVLSIGLLKANGQEKKCDLKEKRITIQMANRPLHDAFIRLMYVYDVPIGFEESTLDKDHDDYFFQTQVPPDDEKKVFVNEPQRRWDLTIKDHLISLDFKDARLEDVLDEIVKQMPNYDWIINVDVVNIFPIKGRDPKFEKLLAIKIRGFGVSKGEEVGMIQPMIVFHLPEFKAFLAENKLRAESNLTMMFIVRPIPMELRFSNLSFKELLNGITRLKRGGWILRTDKRKTAVNKGKEVIEILI
jgi:hypothetical protein